MPKAVAMPTTAPPTESGSPTSEAITTPGNAACARASPIKARFWITTNAPITEQITPMMIAASSARCVGANSTGPARQSTIPEQSCIVLYPKKRIRKTIQYDQLRSERLLDDLLVQHVDGSATGDQGSIQAQQEIEVIL